MQIQDLINHIDSSPERYKHLQIFLNREGNDCKSNYDFLMVSPSVFGKVEILDIQVEEDYIALKFWDYAMQKTGNVRININDEKPSVLFVSWQDVRKMVFEESCTNHRIDGLLELEY